MRRRRASFIGAASLVGGRPLPDREAEIRKQSRIPVDSTVYVSEMRNRG